MLNNKKLVLSFPKATFPPTRNNRIYNFIYLGDRTNL